MTRRECEPSVFIGRLPDKYLSLHRARSRFFPPPIDAGAGVNDYPGGGATRMYESPRLDEEIRFLGRILGDVIREQTGQRMYSLEEEIRLGARARRRGDPDAERTLIERIGSLSDAEARIVTRAFTIFFRACQSGRGSRAGAGIAQERTRSAPGTEEGVHRGGRPYIMGARTFHGRLPGAPRPSLHRARLHRPPDRSHLTPGPREDQALERSPRLS